MVASTLAIFFPLANHPLGADLLARGVCPTDYTSQPKADPDWVLSDEDKKTFDWAFACAGLDGASALTAFGAAVVAAVAALAF